MIKVWHTHLGYERTAMSVRDSLSDILPGADNNDDPVVDVRVHAIIQYPRCYDELFALKSYLDLPNFPVKYGSCAEEGRAGSRSERRVGRRRRWRWRRRRVVFVVVVFVVDVVVAPAGQRRGVEA